MKLVTHERGKVVLHIVILIHTSVKLVTPPEVVTVQFYGILIHTSVKLVTRRIGPSKHGHTDFNPHEREARDPIGLSCGEEPLSF